tara:strand:+ start:327 stop:923 length:597 start_codon:yes stop_codon:yes gene_type:complete
MVDKIMKRLFLFPFLLFFYSPVIAEVEKDPKILCLRNQTAYDISFRAGWKQSAYLNVYLDAYDKESEKFEARGETLEDWSVVDEPFKSIREEWDRLSIKAKNKRNAYARTLTPILELAGYEKPEFYLWYYTAGMTAVRDKHNIVDLRNFEPWQTAQDYYAHSESGEDTRDELCKLYGYEFINRYYDENFKRRYGLKDH